MTRLGLQTDAPNGNTTFEPCWETFDFVDVAPGDSEQVNVNVSGDSDFVWTKTTRVCLDAETEAIEYAFAPFMVNVQDAASGYVISTPNQQLHIENLCGTAQLPAIVPLKGKMWTRASQIAMTVQNKGVIHLTLRVVMWGFKVYGTNPFIRG
jgi:hypothetical protein